MKFFYGKSLTGLGLLAALVVVNLIVSGCASNEAMMNARAELRNSGTPFNRTAFVAAIDEGDSEKVALFLKAGISRTDWRGANPLGTAVYKKRDGILSQLLDGGFDPDIDGYGGTPLCVAAATGNVKAAETLIAKGADVDYLHDCLNPLMAAAKAGHADMARLLIEKGADVDIQSNPTGVFPLRLAAESGGGDVVKALLDAKADTSLADASGNTALYWAVRGGRRETAKLILESPDFTLGDDVDNIIALAMARGYIDLVKDICAKGADPNSEYGQIPLLSWAIAQGYEEGVKALIDAGADLNKPDKDGATPLDYALRSGNSTIIALIKEAAVKVKPTDDTAQ
jgi:ankyrin repeat protein